ncbi:LIC_11490 family protein [Leptospira noguchii]|uniref:LIC_11490 family protein n=1 Tax=Leptospira noguchii TaxID=28182 RepID=UPI000773A9DC|nr:hypothetical protein [Leptospira noguchii]TQE65650.1 hypothetical protein FF021_19220 [Leptospira noguchii]UOG31778.1 hypothetical protein MAL06_07215 [Leptospira noguchii]UOG51409.1 hypothetical protein MAL09_11930 [Leptospira noguchii]
MMLLIAITLVLVGLLCFIYVSLNPSSDREKLGFKSKGNDLNEPGRRGAEILAASKKTPSWEQIEKQKHLENLFVEGRRIPKKNQVLEPSPPESTYEEKKISHSGIEILEEPAAPKEREQKLQEEEIREVRFEIEGILYLDQNREFPFEKLADKKENLTPDKWKGLKRIGPGKLNESRDSFSFEALNSSYKYSFSEIEKILFFDEGIVLIPSKTNYPVPLFFTKETSHLKSYLENSSRTFST